MKNKKINIFFFGAGSIIENHIIAAKNFKDLVLYGIYSRTFLKAKKIKEKYKIKNVYKDLKKISLPSESINIAIVGVNVESTFQVFKKIYKIFDICLLEKPAGYNFLEAKKIKILSKKSKKKFFISLNRRFFSSTLKLKQMLQKDNGRRLLSIVDSQSPINLKNVHPQKVLSNWIFANSIHLIDYINFICRGKLISLKLQKGSTNDLKIFNFLFSSGDLCIYTQLWNRPGPWSVSISTKEKFYKLEPLEQLTYRTKKSYKYQNCMSKSKDIKFKPGFYEIYKNLRLLSYGKKHNLISLDKSFKLMRLINNIKNKKI